MIVARFFVRDHRLKDTIPSSNRFQLIKEFAHDRGQTYFPFDTFYEVNCEGDYGYSDQLGSLWGKDDILIWEHDIVPFLSQYLAIKACPSEFCSFNYHYPGLGGNETWTEVAGASCFGFAKISKRLQTIVSVPLVHWQDLANQMYDLLPPVHIHTDIVDHRHA